MLNGSTPPLISETPGKQLQACVVVPVRNEEELLPSALRSLTEQQTLAGNPLSHDLYEVILLINNTTDRSVEIARRFQMLCPTFRLHIVERKFDKSHAHIGNVRRLLMDEACSRLESIGRPDRPILSTDSDSQVATNWIARNLEELGNGAEAVGGRVIVLPCEHYLLDPAARNLYRYDHLYRRLVSWIEAGLDPEPHDLWPRHHHHFGASLAVLAHTYKRVGRLPLRRHLEDVAFYGSLIRNDIRLRHSNKVRVFTSGRLAGRTRFGLASQLRDWQEWGKDALRMPVETGPFLHHLFAARNRLRLLWLDCQNGGLHRSRSSNANDSSATRLHQLSSTIGITASSLLAELRSAQHFGTLLEELRFYQICRKRWPDSLRLAPLKPVLEKLLAQFKATQRIRHAVPEGRYDTDRSESFELHAMWEGSGTVRVHHRPEAENRVPVPGGVLTTGDRREWHDL